MANEYFLKLDTIEGESTKKGFEKQIEIDSYQWGESQGGSHSVGEHRTVGKVDMQPFTCVVKMTSASPKLFLACATGSKIAKAEFSARKAGGKQEVFLKWKLSDLIISSYQTGGSSSSEIPMDTFTIAYTKIEVEYKPETDKGMGAAVTAGYDLKKMEKV